MMALVGDVLEATGGRRRFRASRNLRRPPVASKTSPTKAIIEALREYASAHGAKFCVGLTRSEPDLEQFLHGSKIPYIDLSTDLRVENDMHWSPEGHAFVAKKIEEFLASEKLF